MLPDFDQPVQLIVEISAEILEGVAGRVLYSQFGSTQAEEIKFKFKDLNNCFLPSCKQQNN